MKKNTNTILEMFQTQVNMAPDRTALIFKEKEISYKELDKKTDKVCYYLLKHGISKEEVIGIIGNRSEKMIIGILGILKAGGTYLPLDKEFPLKRLQYMCEDSKMNRIIVLSDIEFELNGGIVSYSIDEILNYDEGDYALGEITISPSNLAYILYTSGSTGNPKGVMIEHRNIYNFVHGIKKMINFEPGKRIACVTTISFDIFFVEAVLPVLTGMTSAIFDEEAQKDPMLFCQEMLNYNVNMLQITPSRLHLIMRCREIDQCLSNMKDIIIGGEMFPINLIDKLLSKTKGNIFNVYGPTEATIWCSAKKVTGFEDVSIGQPMNKVQYYILNQDMQEIFDDSAGELYISGECIGRGYYQHPELTKKNFFKDLHNENMMMYKSGDFARRLANGEYQCLGRTDDQVKIRGYRVELGEIESIMMQNDSIEQAVVISRENPPGIMNLCCYYKERKPVSEEQLKKYISKRVPAYMVPSIFCSIEVFPYTPNGKINKKELKDPFIHVGLVKSTDMEEQIKAIWCNIVSRSDVDLERNLFEIGGNSILIVHFCEKINNIFGLEWNVIKLYECRNLKEVAENIKKCL